MMAIEIFQASDARRLTSIFLAWKAALVVLTALCPGPGYDTSALILLSDQENRQKHFQIFSIVDSFALKLLRWDAFYFTKAAQRGYLYEQEWAFSRAYSTMLGISTRYVTGENQTSLKYYVLVGFVISNLCHLLSVLVLYRLARLTVDPSKSSKIPFVASILHVLSPGGLFMSAPYTESLFSMLNLTGMLHYVLARQPGKPTSSGTISQDAYMLSSGLFFASATLVRSNGLLSGLIYLYDVACALPSILTLQLPTVVARRIFVTCVAGALLACGFIAPQFLAYKEYCKFSGSNPIQRPWCHALPPSIYTWVQSVYWNVGFLRYWNFSNLPLFLIATPTLWLLLGSSVTVIHRFVRQPNAKSQIRRATGSVGSNTAGFSYYPFPQLAIPQLMLAVTALTNFHVQIINRISSGYPIWYMIVAEWAVNRGASGTTAKGQANFQWAIRWMVMYAIVQGILFAGFLPPA